MLINDAIRDLRNNDGTAAIAHLNLAEQQFVTSANASASTNHTMVLLSDAIRDLQEGDKAASLTHLDLAVQQLES